MKITRRILLTGAAAIAVMGSANTALALSESDAKDHVSKTLDDLLALLRTPGNATSRAPRLRQIMETRANVPQLAKFSAGRVWREMSGDQQSRFVDAFSHFISITYARRFDEYSGDPKIALGRSRDAGRKGWLVETPINLPNGEKAAVEWLVSDRAGSTQVVDLIVEGISMAVTQREEIGVKFKQRGNDVEALIKDLKAAI
ncbi:MAG: ABC transporter substrate-binding protein [Pseudomonadota bacterium]